MEKTYDMASKGLSHRLAGIPVPAIIAVILFSYFEVYYHFWFLKLTGGYVFKIWVPPVLAFLLLAATGRTGLLETFRAVEVLMGLLAAYVFFGMISLIAHETLFNIGKYGLIMFAPLTLFLCILLVFKKDSDIEAALKAMFLTGLLFSLYTAYSFFYAGPESWADESITRKFMWSGQTLETKLSHATYYEGNDTGRITRVSIHGVDEPKFGAMLAPLVLTGLYYAFNSTGFVRLLYLAPSLFMYFMIIKTLARSSIIAGSAGLLIFFWYAIKKGSNAERLIAVLIMLVMGGIYFSDQANIARTVTLIDQSSVMGKLPAVKNYLSRNRIQYSEEGHLASYKEAARMVKEAPVHNLSGLGFKKFEDTYGDNRWAAPHSRYVKILNTAGFLTVIPYLGFILCLIAISYIVLRGKIRGGRFPNDIGLILFPASVIFAIKLNNEGMETYYYWVFFGFAAAWIRNAAHEGKNENIAH